MADAMTLDQVLQEQQAIAVLSGELGKTSDPEKIEQLAAMIQAMVDNLQAMLEQLEAEFKEANPQAFDVNGAPIAGLVPRIEVVLTPSQREQIQAETGVDMPSVLIEDPNGTLTQLMKETSPEEIEVIAMEKARAFIAMSQAIEEAARERAELEAALPDDVKAMLAEQQQG